MTRHLARTERGAAAVEFALIVPVLLLLVFGVIEFSRLYNEQISLTNAARSAARVMAIGNNQAAAVAEAIVAAPALDPPLTGGDVAVSPSACTVGATTTVTITYSASLLTGWFGTTIPLTGKAAMPCGG
ncbi:TadE/TadG family type IV pilus assembly protein [Agromyces sp. NPDC056379]|uniref:TadE/TadG family type IV pilus assembly protein n=1 Tax=unclassified Agromyces TaxID=2639701 RepID=UPI0035E241F9